MYFSWYSLCSLVVWRFLLTSDFKTFVHLRYGNVLAFIVLYLNLSALLSVVLLSRHLQFLI